MRSLCKDDHPASIAAVDAMLPIVRRKHLSHLERVGQIYPILRRFIDAFGAATELERDALRHATFTDLGQGQWTGKPREARGHWGEVSPSVPSMPIAIFGSVPDAELERAAPCSLGGDARGGPGRPRGRRPARAVAGEHAVLMWRELEYLSAGPARP